MPLGSARIPVLPPSSAVAVAVPATANPTYRCRASSATAGRRAVLPGACRADDDAQWVVAGRCYCVGVLRTVKPDLGQLGGLAVAVPAAHGPGRRLGSLLTRTSAGGP